MRPFRFKVFNPDFERVEDWSMWEEDGTIYVKEKGREREVIQNMRTIIKYGNDMDGAKLHKTPIKLRRKMRMFLAIHEL